MRNSTAMSIVSLPISVGKSSTFVRMHGNRCIFLRNGTIFFQSKFDYSFRRFLNIGIRYLSKIQSPLKINPERSCYLLYTFLKCNSPKNLFFRIVSYSIEKYSYLDILFKEIFQFLPRKFEIKCTYYQILCISLFCDKLLFRNF